MNTPRTDAESFPMRLVGDAVDAEFARKLELEISSLRAGISAARGLLEPLGNQVTPSVLAIREALQILRHL